MSICLAGLRCRIRQDFRSGFAPTQIQGWCGAVSVDWGVAGGAVASALGLVGLEVVDAVVVGKGHALDLTLLQVTHMNLGARRIEAAGDLRRDAGPQCFVERGVVNFTDQVQDPGLRLRLLAARDPRSSGLGFADDRIPGPAIELAMPAIPARSVPELLLPWQITLSAAAKNLRDAKILRYQKEIDGSYRGWQLFIANAERLQPPVDLLLSSRS